MSYSDQHYGVGDPNCKICGGVGYVRYDVPDGHQFFGKVFDCTCRGSQIEEERHNYMRRIGGLANLSDKIFSTFNAEGVGLPERDQQNLRYAFERAKAYAEQPLGWLIITGGYGCGKTHLAAAIANSRIESGEKVIFITVPDLLDHLRASLSAANDEDGYSARIEEIRNTALLILDDMGTESPTAWAQEKLYQILNYRYTAHLPTVITTNHSLDALEPRIRSRLSDPDVCERVAITARDYRAADSEQNDLNGMVLYRHMTFDNFEMRRDLKTREQQTELHEAFQVAKDFASNPNGWVVFMGAYGSGKTHLAAAIGNFQLAKGMQVLFITVPDLLDHLRATFAPNSAISYDKRFSELKNTALLILDDLSLDSATPWAREKLHQLLDYRYNARLATVITTSHNAKKLQEADPRLAARIRDARFSTIIKWTIEAYQGSPQKV